MAHWETLDISNATQGTPPLLVSSEFNTNSYKISVTDLSRLWTEELDRRQLIKRALIDNTSIDPSEDPSQLKIFLSKIESALRGDEGTSLQVTAKDDDSLHLHVYCVLPAPLDLLKWRVELSLQAQELVRSKVTQPLVERLGSMDLREEELLRNIRDKDVVINKLLDKLEVVGTDISDVFPGATGSRAQRKAISRAQIAQQVKGLGKFDKDEWLQQAERAQDHVPSNELMTRVFGRGKVSVGGSQPDQVAWGWQKELNEKPVSSGKVVSSGSRVREEPQTKARQTTPPPSQPTDEDGDDFQRQTSPPGVKDMAGNAHVEHANDASETEDEDDDLDAPAPTSRKAKQPSNHVIEDNAIGPSEPKPKKLGQLGGKRKAAENDKPSPEEDQERPEPVPEPAKRQASTEPQSSKMKVKGKLGTIGGRKQAREATPEIPVPEPASAAKTPSRIHGRIGGSKQTTPSKRHSPEVKKESQIERVQETQLHQSNVDEEQPPESSQDRADRKREELKRQLEEKSHAPAKKKRRF